MFLCCSLLVVLSGCFSPLSASVYTVALTASGMENFCLPSLKSLRGSFCLETGISSRITNNTTSCKNYMHMINKSQISMWVRKK